MATVQQGDDWTDDELKIVLYAYLEVLAWEQRGRAFSPTALHRSLAAGSLSPRSEGAIARRMSNISSVLKEANLPWVKRYKPSFSHVGPRVTGVILSLMKEVRAESEKATSDLGAAVDRASALMSQGHVTKPDGCIAPEKQTGTSTSFKRDPRVIAWVLQEAAGICEACQNDAPFTLTSGRPYLEVHHVRRLADGGPDVVENAVALCPNCHRRMHHSSDAEAFGSKLLKNVARLTAL